EDLGAQIAFEECTEFRIDILLKLRLKLRRREVLVLQIPCDELRKYQTAIEETGEPGAGISGELYPGCPVARGALLVRTAAALVNHRDHPVPDFVTHVAGMLGSVAPLKRPLVRG